MSLKNASIGRYSDSVWNVPAPVYDHPAVRSWQCQTKQKGWADLRCSDLLMFHGDVLKQFRTDAKKKRWRQSKRIRLLLC